MTTFPAGYKSALGALTTESAIKFVKDTFQRELSGALCLSRATSPMFVEKGKGINDDLNGVEKPVSFSVSGIGKNMEVVHSLAKWKRMFLADHGFAPYTGIYTDMNALRPDDTIDPIHSVYVDQWDWEMVIKESDRNIDFLKKIVREIYSAIRRTEFLLSQTFTSLTMRLPENITFIHTEDAEKIYPELTPKQREYELSKKYGAIFLIGIGALLSNGLPHDGRAPDYDDWITSTTDGKKGLNGDIIVYNPVRDESLELSSMGIRVSKESLLEQLKIRKLEERKNLYWHKRLLNGEFPFTIGGGIGQSRLCMYLLQKAHLGEVQASVWSDETVEEAKKNGIRFLS